jgi:hypothetical protein
MVGLCQAARTIVQQHRPSPGGPPVALRKEVPVETAVAMLALLVALVVAVTRR